MNSMIKKDLYELQGMINTAKDNVPEFVGATDYHKQKAAHTHILMIYKILCKLVALVIRSIEDK